MGREAVFLDGFWVIEHNMREVTVVWKKDEMSELEMVSSL